ncbi:WW domain-containing oxidoreductase [Anthonomus grandis grandis]|uniref:WW domain-containing oxidoreductase n=1 Tax=Anthonomus grandis grandis TaxID=2921223 RepID=UPI00216600E4|nr:WW domain-containing oxidoreductase [Anthonomus grandis grandis]
MNFADEDSDDELPPGWEERVTVDGTVYYANHLTKNTQWTHPRTGRKKKVAGSLPFGWERVVSSDGKVVYVNHQDESTTYIDPRLAFAIEEKENVTDFRQRFDASSTALQVLLGRDLSGKVAIVTGANTGIGYETARSLAKHGCTVIFACRNVVAAEEAIEVIRSQERLNIADNCHALHLDLASLASVSNFVNVIKSRYQQIHMLILNAGVFGLPYSKTIDNLETTFQVNHLSHFYLTLMLESLLVSGSRVVVVSSESHRFTNLTTDNIDPLKLSPDTRKHYSDLWAYNNSKLCNVLFARQLALQLQERGISVFSCHPGNMVYSNLSKSWWLYRILFALARPFTKSLQQAAACSVYCATALELAGVTGVYFNNCCPCEESKEARNDELAKKLWNISIDMVGQVLGSSDLEKFLLPSGTP